MQNLLAGGAKSRVRTTLDKENLRSFNEHKAARKGFAGFRNYGTWPACTYSFMAKKADGKLLTDVVTLSSRPVKDRFMVSSRHSKGLSTALIGIDGTAYDYNWVDNEDGTRFTRENFNAVIAKKFQKELSRDPVRARNLVVIDPMSIGFPVFPNASRMPGEVAARIVKTDGSTYGEYVYAGLLNYKGYPALKLEVMLNRDGQVAGGPILIGYALIRQDNLMPLRFVWQTDRMEISELIRCV
ncbi:hypothetical protein [Novosphingobium aquae]|uniref:Uncharacterized protein n=1 Tax=Novosphingobium aquae TaxID=3133435 RepID=A0ABU8SC03_9SPHN